MDWSVSYVTETTTIGGGKFTFDNVCAGVYKVTEVTQTGWTLCTNPPLRAYYIVIVTEENALNGDTITVDVYGDELLFGNKPPGTWPFGQVTGVTAQAEGPC